MKKMLVDTQGVKCIGAVEPIEPVVMSSLRSSLVRRNILDQKNYTPYCGAEHCFLTWPRSTFDGEQFTCRCGWRSSFESDFISEYKKTWGK